MVPSTHLSDARRIQIVIAGGSGPSGSTFRWYFCFGPHCSRYGPIQSVPTESHYDRQGMEPLEAFGPIFPSSFGRQTSSAQSSVVCKPEREHLQEEMHLLSTRDQEEVNPDEP